MKMAIFVPTAVLESSRRLLRFMVRAKSPTFAFAHIFDWWTNETRVVREQLMKVKAVASVKDEHVDRGGDGITVVVLK